MNATKGMDMERRSFTRVIFKAEATVSYGGNSFTTPVKNVSLKGMFLETLEDMPLNEPLEVKIVLSGNTTRLTVNLKGKATRQDDSGFAILFDGMDLDSFVHLKNVITCNATDREHILQEFLAYMARHKTDTI